MSQSSGNTNEQNDLTLSNVDLFTISQHLSLFQCQTKLTVTAGTFYYVNGPDTTWKLTPCERWVCSSAFPASCFSCYVKSSVLCYSPIIFTLVFNSCLSGLKCVKNPSHSFKCLLLSFGYAEFSSCGTVGAWQMTTATVFIFSPVQETSCFRVTGHRVETDFPYWLIYAVDVSSP